MKDLAAGERLGRKFTFSPFIPHGRGLRVCYDIDPMYLQGQDHNAYIVKTNVKAITPYCHVGSG